MFRSGGPQLNISVGAIVVKRLLTQEDITTTHLNTEHWFSLLIFVRIIHTFATNSI